MQASCAFQTEAKKAGSPEVAGNTCEVFAASKIETYEAASIYQPVAAFTP